MTAEHKVDKDLEEREALKDLVHRVVIFKDEKDTEDGPVPGSTYCGSVIQSYEGNVVRCHFIYVLSEDGETWIALERIIEWRGHVRDNRVQLLEVTVGECRKKAKRNISTSQPSHQTS